DLAVRAGLVIPLGLAARDRADHSALIVILVLGDLGWLPTVPPLERNPYSRRRRDFLSEFVVVRKTLGEKGTSTSLLLRFHTASWSFWNWAEVSKSNNSLISLGSSSGDIHALVIASSKNVSRLTPSWRSFTSSLRGGCASTSLYHSRRSNARRRTG